MASLRFVGLTFKNPVLLPVSCSSPLEQWPPEREPMTLLMMPEWFEALPQFSDQIDRYEANILSLLALLSDRKISEASFLMLLRRHTERFRQAEFWEAHFLREASESEIAKIKVALETLEAQKIGGER